MFRIFFLSFFNSFAIGFHLHYNQSPHINSKLCILFHSFTFSAIKWNIKKYFTKLSKFKSPDVQLTTYDTIAQW
ncbi:hypothetical protein ACB098_11G092600 [Castanea mollissima]